MQKALFVTGGTVGTGLAIAHKFAENGYAVFISSRSGERAEQAAREVAAAHGGHAKGYALDIRDEERIKEIFRDIDAQDCFVETVALNSADLGFGTDPAKGQDFVTVPVEEFQRVFETNLGWNFMIIRQAALRMREHGKGAIVFVSSNTSYRAIPGRVAYSASKGGINTFTKALAKELAPSGISVNAIACGVIDTRMNGCFDAAERAALEEEIPMGRYGTPEEAAALAWQLATAPTYLTGQILSLDGGWQS